jgi:NAD(P)-dependent dehydrogenase (short-subunit alcohol dehydrogenase family)
MSASLNGKRVVVLGKTSGIGLATAKATQREGPMIAVASDAPSLAECRSRTRAYASGAIHKRTLEQLPGEAD